MNKNFKIVKELVKIAKELIADNKTQPDLYLLEENGTIVPVCFPQDIIVASKKKKKNNSPTGKTIFLTQQAYNFYNEMGPTNQSDFRKYCNELKTNGTLRGNPHGEKVEGVKGVFCIRLTLGESNDRYFYCYKERNLIIVFDAYTKATERIPVYTLNQAKEDMKKLLSLATTDELVPFDTIVQEAEQENNNPKGKNQQ